MHDTRLRVTYIYGPQLRRGLLHSSAAGAAVSARRADGAGRRRRRSVADDIARRCRVRGAAGLNARVAQM